MRGLSIAPHTICASRGLCIALLSRTLKKNICGLNLSTLRWKEELPEDIAYAARYWMDHLCNSVTHCDAATVDEFYRFLRVHFLHWIEAMTLMRKARQTIGLMIQSKGWVESVRVSHHFSCSEMSQGIQ